MKPTRRQRGSVLITVIVVLLLVSLGGLALTLTLQDYARLQEKQRDALRAFHAAEAGGWEVSSWFNTSGSVIADHNATFANMFIRDNASSFPYHLLDAFLRGHYEQGVDVARHLPNYLPIKLTNENGVNEGEITSLHLWSPEYEPLKLTHAPFLDMVIVVRSEGTTPKGSRKVAWFWMTPWWLEGAPAPIVSRAATNFGGNAVGRWGEVWARSMMDTPLESQMKQYVQNDPWLKYRTEQQITWDSTWGADTWGKPWHKDPVTGRVVIDGTDQPAAGFVSRGVDYSDVFWQFQKDLEWPHYDYERFKRLAKRKGRYFATDASGNLYRDGIVDADHLTTDPARDLNTGTLADRSSDPDVWKEVDYDVIFVDTIDRQPPRADGSNIAPAIKIQGDGMSWKGFYYICANMDLAGSPASAIPAKDPDGVYAGGGKRAFMDGILCVRGEIKITGNPVVYGSVFAERGFSGTGTMDVWYNAELKDGFPAPIHPMVTAYYKITQ